MHFFRLTDDLHVPRRWHLGDVTAGGEDYSDALTDGRPITVAGSLAAEVSRQGSALDFSLTSLAVPVGKRGLVEAIASVAGEDVQRLPVVVPGHDADVEIINVQRVVDCLDEGRSEFVKWTIEDDRPDRLGQYRSVTKLRIDPARVPENVHVFRIAGWVVPIIVSARVRAAMEAVGCRGAKFDHVT